MKSTITALLVLSFIFILAFAIFGQAIQDRTPVPPSAPNCNKGDKGDCAAVCNSYKKNDKSVDPAGCVTEMMSLIDKSPKILCPGANARPFFVGCDAPTTETCFDKTGAQGVWCSCYFRCYDITAT